MPHAQFARNQSHAFVRGGCQRFDSQAAQPSAEAT